MSGPRAGLALMLEPAFLQAALPLLDAGEVEVLEWSFDMGWGRAGIPEWCARLLAEYSAARRLTGHGVTFSPLSGHWTERQARWLENLAWEVQQRDYLHLSEHFGFMAAGHFHQGAPLPVPLGPETLAVGQDRMRAMADAAGVPVGLENLALAFRFEDVQQQGDFIEQLLEPVDGFLLLDLHNLYCQVCNFDWDAERLLQAFPLDRVRELHLSGGSWSEACGRTLRRDTHDHAVPEALFTLLEQVLPRCPEVRAVILERLGYTLEDAEEQRAFQADFRRMRKIVEARTVPRHDEALALLQLRLLEALHAESDPAVIRERLLADPDCAAYRDWLAELDPAMLVVAAELVKQWAVGEGLQGERSARMPH